MSGLEQIKYKFQQANMVEKLIAVNVVLFILTFAFKTFAFLLQIPEGSFLDWVVFSKDLEELIFKPWSIVSYAFFHGGLFHLFFNMLLLYYAGSFFLTYFSPKKLLNFYFLGAICGALVYALSFNLFPAFTGIGKSYLIGASASVMAILVGIATHIPYMGVRLLILGTVKLWHIAAFFVILDIIRIPMGNAGGHLAHLGGALLGYIYVKQLAKGNDIGLWWEKLMNGFAGLFSSKKKSPFKTVHRNKTSTRSASKTKSNKDEKQRKIDAILDKISKSGYDSLSKEEKDFLFKSGKD
ncbi:MAG TPA: rhomboid family intramembrane serine protease [Flavobacteriaceae bacterium]|nr:rhomboid family intramembrane serine protease [Flavobacteriaceae bacterium]